MKGSQWPGRSLSSLAEPEMKTANSDTLWGSSNSFCVYYPEFFYNRDSQKCEPQAAALVFPDNLLEMQIRGFYPRSTSEVMWIGTSNLCFHKPSG